MSKQVVKEEKKVIQIGFRLPEDTYIKARVKLVKAGITVQTLLEHCVSEYLAGNILNKKEE